MGIDRNFGMAFAKAQMGAGNSLPDSGKVFVSVNDADKEKVVPLARRLHELGFEISSTTGTAAVLSKWNIPNKIVFKVSEPGDLVEKAVDLIAKKEFALVINTPRGKADTKDHDAVIRKAALLAQIPYTTTLAAAEAAVAAIDAWRHGDVGVCSMQEYYRQAGIPVVQGLVQKDAATA
jgi:carbamoyl-phosphate synthase large subunit